MCILPEWQSIPHGHLLRRRKEVDCPPVGTAQRLGAWQGSFWDKPTVSSTMLGPGSRLSLLRHSVRTNFNSPTPKGKLLWQWCVSVLVGTCRILSANFIPRKRDGMHLFCKLLHIALDSLECLFALEMQTKSIVLLLCAVSKNISARFCWMYSLKPCNKQIAKLWKCQQVSSVELNWHCQKVSGL